MKRAFTLIEALILVAIVAVIAAVLWPVFARQNTAGRRPTCQMNLKQLGLGFMQYMQDYDEKFPPARVTASTGWADVIQPYVKSIQLLQCDKASIGPTSTPTTDYFYNRRLARLATGKVNEPASILLLGDGDDNAPTWNSWMQLPADATTNSDSPAQRHTERANYCFADGHVKALKPAGISSSSSPQWSPPTFAIR